MLSRRGGGGGGGGGCYRSYKTPACHSLYVHTLIPMTSYLSEDLVQFLTAKPAIVVIGDLSRQKHWFLLPDITAILKINGPYRAIHPEFSPKGGEGCSPPFSQVDAQKCLIFDLSAHTHPPPPPPPSPFQFSVENSGYTYMYTYM